MLIFPCFLLLLYVSIFSSYSIVANTITSNKSITDGETITSPGGVFELGFFGNESRYLGVWYKNISSHNIVWVANKDRPLTDSSGVSRIDSHGNLVLVDRNGSLLWSSNISSTAPDSVAELLDSGNLILSNNNSANPDSYLWQSFDFPSNTLLPGMKLGWTLNDGLNRYLTSWKSETDPSQGEFTVGFENHLLPQIVVRKRSIKYNRIGPYNGISFSGAGEFRGVLYKPSFIFNKNEVYYEEEPADNSVIIRFELNPYGFFEHLTWDYQFQNWSLWYSLETNRCGYNMCGENTLCKFNYSNSMPDCECLNGYTPKSPKGWSLLNYSGGCVPIPQLNFGKEDKFELLPRVQLPDILHYWLNTSINLEDCEAECLRNFSCMAYANSDILTSSGCILWFDNLVDIQQFDDEGQDLYVRVGTLELESNKESKKKESRQPTDEIKIILPAVSALLVFGLIVGYILLNKTYYRKGRNIVNNQDLASSSLEEELELPLYDLATIATATNNFSLSNKIGCSTDGARNCNKKLSKNSRQGFQEFKNEVVLTSSLQHRNLVRLLGCCIQGEERILIYEYMPNKSLNSIIFDGTNSVKLNWKRRFSIIVGIARGLLYLHQDSRLRVIHRDLKASNILLDSQMNPKISDFGIARTFVGDQTEENTKRVVGTYGYISPEYAKCGLFSIKSDVFSFGVLVLEIVSGKTNRYIPHVDHHLNLLGHAWTLLTEGKALELMDPSIEDPVTLSEVLKCIQVTLLCVQKFPKDRPKMSSVLVMLDTDGLMLPWPKQPGFFVQDDLSATQNEALTRNDCDYAEVCERRMEFKEGQEVEVLYEKNGFKDTWYLAKIYRLYSA
ncbi:hypothetical protein IFM89_039136 [Coptis chinensis]|uniref:Receptor-like serine/threonine-protein kinase n=1 Tax=Coptis chinensis TaxID=261450 RepID=A0A835LFS4_9MAGN|nr:hypothetical protein IFM89_039136 [Coptis chinensis]